jgi:hypothetical protein
MLQVSLVLAVIQVDSAYATVAPPPLPVPHVSGPPARARGRTVQKFRRATGSALRLAGTATATATVPLELPLALTGHCQCLSVPLAAPS